MKVFELGEFGLIEVLADIIHKTKNPKNISWQQLLIDIGDDAAVWHSDSLIQIATTDSLIQDTHFDLNTITWEELGWKAIAVNLSDIAAMGGIPRYALVSLALPGNLEVDCISRLYQGMAQIANQFEVAIAGGNIASASQTMITVTILGNLQDASALTRSAATPGDQIAITGYTGLSAAGIRMLKQNLNFDTETKDILRKTHHQPMPRIEEGQILLQQGVKTAIDISDGLIADLAHICKASYVGASIKKDLVPIHPTLLTNFETDCYQLALTGGEDYELLFTAKKDVIARVKQSLACPVTIIGEITDAMSGKVTLSDTDGNDITWQQTGWEHFKSQI